MRESNALEQTEVNSESENQQLGWGLLAASIVSQLGQGKESVCYATRRAAERVKHEGTLLR